jgi:GNAT superfamily N-acetyltransferase
MISEGRESMVPGVAIRRLTQTDASAFDALRCAYGKEMGGTSKPDVQFCKALMTRPSTHIWGAFGGDDLHGFLIAFELPEAVYGRTILMMDDLFVSEAQRGRGLARAMIDVASLHCRTQGLVHLRWLVPEDDHAAIRLYDKIAQQAPWRSYVIRFDETASA